ncbi:MAG: DUF3422 domain-containing protein [Burkholderiaceae bacterium]
MLATHPLRESLHNEVHARPYEQLSAPLTLSHLALLTPDPVASRAHLHRLLEARHLPLPSTGASHLSVDLGGVRLRWEQHTEFQTFTFWRTPAPGATGLGDTALAHVSSEWLHALPGQWLVGLHMIVADALAESAVDAVARGFLDETGLVGAAVSDGQGLVVTDFRLHADSFARQLLNVQGMNPRRLGRTVQRLLEIETYRMMALLGLPVARQVAATLQYAERDLARVAEQIRSAKQESEPELLRQLTQLAGEVESLYAATHARFSASSAYFELVQRRIEELHEVRHGGLQTLGEFMDRRLAPAMQTCAWAARRQQGLSERIARISSLLRTRVEIEQQQSSQGLLDAMNRRQRAQMLLQSAVEGLSVAAVTYYGAGLVGYVAKGAKAVGMAVSPDLATALSIPLIAFAFWLALRRVRRRALSAADRAHIT